MDGIDLNGNWSEQKSRLRVKFAVLTENDLLFAEGTRDEMISKLERKLGKTKEEILNILANI